MEEDAQAPWGLWHLLPSDPQEGRAEQGSTEGQAEAQKVQGPVAHPGERFGGIEEVRGSTPLGSIALKRPCERGKVNNPTNEAAPAVEGKRWGFESLVQGIGNYLGRWDVPGRRSKDPWCLRRA